jgi:hypothetical protein
MSNNNNNNNKDDNINNNKKNKNYSNWETKQKIKKLNKFSLTKEDKFLLNANDNEIKDLVIKEIKKNLKRISNEIDTINQHLQNKNNIDNKNLLKEKKHKKYLKIKQKKLKLVLEDEGAIKSRMKLLKLKKRKLNTKKIKIEKNLGNLKDSLKRCLKCKKRGHLAKNCPLNENNNNDDNNIANKNNTNNNNICYNCGSNKHGLYECDKPIDYSNLPFAECYICKKKGHISANCPNNKNGIYIRGGSCYICNSKEHLAKNCPQKHIKEDAYKLNKKNNDNK